MSGPKSRPTSALWIWHTASACSICSLPVEYLGTDWHHAGPSDHAVEVVVWIVPESELLTPPPL
jgi:hypothetical protein